MPNFLPVEGWNGFQISTKDSCFTTFKDFSRGHTWAIVMNALCGVCSRSTRETRELPGRCHPHHSTADLFCWGQWCPFHIPYWPLTKAIILNLWWNLKVLEVDRSLIKTGLPSMPNFVRSCLTSDCSVEYIHFPCPQSVISIVGESKIGVPGKLYSTLIWDTLNQEAHVFFFWLNVH